MGSDRRRLENMRDCVKCAFDKGCARGDEFHKMRHAIILELFRVGFDVAEIKDELLEWNNRCEKPLPPSEQKIHLCGYVDWVFKKECKIGCKALEGYCIGEKKCQFFLRTKHRNRQQTKALPFDVKKLEQYLTERFRADGYGLMLVVSALMFIQHEKATGEIIFAGYRAIASVIRDKDGHTLHPMDVHRKIKVLIEEGVLTQMAKGKPGNFSRKSNGYQFLPWQPPNSAQAPILTHMCNTESLPG